ncbi:C2H2 finger domain-containing protein [Beauveria brongniartii RCEF 3172]|uniref:C2H2 finger domain-containing protein n=1 Tax=Beauveria brongniartii RCEF 3172 TaxID=1081107 RepID=A0A166Z3Z5_9HYPO|nr:C2H2 finger domain-containing protein [Beauveria brongniartii RCEF 3172]
MSQRLGKLISLNVRKRESSSSRKRGKDVEGAAALSAPRVSLWAAAQPSHSPPAPISPVDNTNELPNQQIHDTFSEIDAQASYDSAPLMSNYSEHLPLTPGTSSWEKQHARDIDSGRASMKLTKPQAVPLVTDTDDEEEDDDEYFFEKKMEIENTNRIDSIAHDLAGFRQRVFELNPALTHKGGNYLADRIAHQQVFRYNYLLDLRLNHTRQGVDCVALGGSAKVLGQNRISAESFPPGIPMPPTQYLPAEIECQLCYQRKILWKPSDWTRHVYQDLKPFTCTWDTCKDPKPFENKGVWLQHENENHRHLQWWTCDVEDCRHSCFRQENFLQHLVREHKFPEPKAETKKRTGDVEPAWQKVEDCHQKKALRPYDEPCKFCGRAFTTWKRLTVHLAKHMEQISLPVLLLVEAKAREIEAGLTTSPAQDPSNMCDCRNIYEDMKPYMCLVEECLESVSGYATFQEWFNHMENHSPTWNQELYQSPTWICAICEQREVAFSGPEDLSAHMKQSHASRFSDKQLDIIAYRSRIFKRRPSNECLLCGLSIQGEKGEKGEKASSQTMSLKQQGGHSGIPKAESDMLSADHDGTSNQSGTVPSLKPPKAVARHIASHLQALMFLTMHIVSEQKDTGSQDYDLETKNDDAVMTDPYSIRTDKSVSGDNYRQSAQLPAEIRFPDLGAPVLTGVGLEEERRPRFKPWLSADSVVGCSTSYDMSSRYRSGRIHGSIFSSAHDGMPRASRTTTSSKALREMESTVADIDEGGMPDVFIAEPSVTPDIGAEDHWDTMGVAPVTTGGQGSESSLIPVEAHDPGNFSETVPLNMSTSTFLQRKPTETDSSSRRAAQSQSTPKVHEQQNTKK